MAEMAVSFAIDQILPLLREEFSLLKGIHKELADIKDELESIQAFLKDADTRAAATEGDNTNEGVKTWVKQVREAAFRIEDVFDDYTILLGQKLRHPGCVVLFHEIVYLLKTIIPRHQIASEIQDIKLSVRGIKKRSERYGFQIQPSIEQGSTNFRVNQNVKWHDPRIAALFINEAEIVGFEGPKKRLISWLVEGRTERTVISVVGIGGQGKTTIAKKVFDNKEVRRHFVCCVWITVSQSYNIEELLRGMLKEVYKQTGGTPPQNISKMNRVSLIYELRNNLQQKRYVFVFDDVWNQRLWDEIEYAMKDNKNGSRIFITTRNNDVAMYCKKSSFIEVHQLESLTDEQSFELFNKKAFQIDFDGCSPKHLIDISFEIARKCKGLPLAIVTIGGLLSTKEKNVLEWQIFCKNMTFELHKNPQLTEINKILGFSYDDLPFHLKSCLLYFGIYPEDFQVNSNRLIRQWVAEGFVKEETGSTLEKVAEGYLQELIHRSLVKVSSIRIDGKTKSCCVHDLIHTMILEKCEDLSFCKHISEDGHSSFPGIIRRLSITINSNDFTTCVENSHVRSLFLFSNESKNLDKYFMRRVSTEYKRLKVLGFEGAGYFSIYRSIGRSMTSLIHLKYLSFKNCHVELSKRKLSKFIGMLQNLETLDLRSSFSFIYEIPKEISKLRKLRHLLGYQMSLFRLKGVIGGMESLQTLSDVRINEDEIEIIRELGNLKQLRKLSLFGVRREHGSILSASLNEMQYLEKLRVGPKFINTDEVDDLHLVLYLPMLRNLVLRGRLEKLPEWIPKIQCLVKLKLERSNLTDDPIKFLENMSNLLSLSIQYNAYEGESLHFHDEGFQNLKELYIGSFPNLNSIIIDEGALGSLKRFELSQLPDLNLVPYGIQYLKKLEVLNVWDVPLAEFYPKL